MKKILKTGVLMTLALAAPQAMMAQVTVLSDNFSTSTMNGNDVGAVTSTSTSYDFEGSKIGGETIGSGDLDITTAAGTSSGEVEAQALFTTTPVQLATPGDYIDLTYTFTDEGAIAGAASSSSSLYTGLYYSGGAVPDYGTVGTSGNAITITLGAATATYNTGGVQGWEGYIGRIQATSSGLNEIYSRSPQGNNGTTASAQDLVGSSGTAFTGAFNNPNSSANLAGTPAVGVTLTSGSVYTLDYRMTLASAGLLTIAENLYNGTGTGGTEVITPLTASSVTALTTEFDGLAIGAYEKAASSLYPGIEISQLTVTDDIQPVPEPDTLALLGGGMVLLQMARRRLQARG